jgi:hypothetical protein
MHTGEWPEPEFPSSWRQATSGFLRAAIPRGLGVSLFLAPVPRCPATRPVVLLPSGLPVILIATGVAARSVHPFFRNDRNHNQGGCGVCPTTGQKRHSEASHRAELPIDRYKTLSAWHLHVIAALLSCTPTRRFARESRGITTSETQARIIPGRLCSGALLSIRLLAASKPT